MPQINAPARQAPLAARRCAHSRRRSTSALPRGSSAWWRRRAPRQASPPANTRWTQMRQRIDQRRDVAGGRKQRPVDRERQDQQDAEPEARQRQSAQRQQRGGVIGGAVAAGAATIPAGMAMTSEITRAAADNNAVGASAPSNSRQHQPSALDRAAEITGQDVAEPGDILDEKSADLAQLRPQAPTATVHPPPCPSRATAGSPGTSRYQQKCHDRRPEQDRDEGDQPRGPNSAFMPQRPLD